MLRLILFVTFFCFIQVSKGQQKTLKTPFRPPSQKEMRFEERNHNCIKKFRKAFTNRLRYYPFNLSTQIQFVSFIGNTTRFGDEVIINNDSLPRLNDTICYSKLYEVKTLTLSQIDSLTDLLYNYGFFGRVYTMSVSGCYNPRNAILFLDNSGKVFEFIEICFECERFEKSSEKIQLGEMCNQKFSMLKEMFKKLGIEYGVTKGF